MESMESLLTDEYRVLPVLEEALRRRVCTVCIDRNPDGTCAKEALHECVLFDRLPEITRSICRVQSDKIDVYIAAIRTNICASCLHQDLTGFCKEREEVRCALDRYLVPIIEAIEEVRGVVLEPGRLLT